MPSNYFSLWLLYTVNLYAHPITLAPTRVCRGRILGQNSTVLFTVTSAAALLWDFYFFKLPQPFTVSTVQLLYNLYIVKEQRKKPVRKPHPLPFGLRNPYRNLKSENSRDYVHKPQRNCIFRNSASVQYINPFLIHQGSPSLYVQTSFFLNCLNILTKPGFSYNLLPSIGL
jgi:hypothetical protein